MIRIQTTEFFRPKSLASENDVPVDPELMEIFRGFRARQKVSSSSRATAPPDNDASPMSTTVA